MFAGLEIKIVFSHLAWYTSLEATNEGANFEMTWNYVTSIQLKKFGTT